MSTSYVTLIGVKCLVGSEGTGTANLHYICRFCIVNLLKYICGPKSRYPYTFTVICGYVQSGRKFELLFPAEVKQGNCLFVSALILKATVVFTIYLVPFFFFTFLCFLLVISMFKMAPSQMLKYCLCS